MTLKANALNRMKIQPEGQKGLWLCAKCYREAPIGMEGKDG